MRKIRILSFLLCLLMVLAAVGCTDEGNTTSGAASQTANASSAELVSSEEELPPYAKREVYLVDNPGKWRIAGRTMQVIDARGYSAMSYDHAAQGFFFNADCEGDVSVNITLKIPSKTLGKYALNFLVRVDGAESYVTVEGDPAGIRSVLPVATGLSQGKHSFEIYRCNDYLKGQGALTSVELNGILLNYEAPKKALKMAFIGDSVTSGSGLFAENGKEDQATRDPSDATHGYAFLCAKELDADFTIASRSGSYSIKDSKPDSIYYTYDYVSRVRNETLYDNTKEDVDVFVISLGTNDCDSKRGFTDEQIHDSIQALITRVRADHPNAKIVWTFGQMNKERISVVRGAVEEMKASDSKLYFYEYTISDSSGGWWHPSAEAQARDGKELAEFIRSNVL